MKTLFDQDAADEMKARLARLGPDSERQWGTMTAAQAVAHMNGGFALAFGELRPSRKFVGRILGPIIKPLAFKDDAPMRKNSPTVDEMVVRSEPNLEAERVRLRGMIDRFVAGGPAACTSHPHSFFGPLTPTEWAILMYKHVDHHLRQFGV